MKAEEKKRGLSGASSPLSFPLAIHHGDRVALCPPEDKNAFVSSSYVNSSVTEIPLQLQKAKEREAKGGEDESAEYYCTVP